MTPWEARLAAVQAILPDDLTLIDNETFAEIVDEDGAHVALVGFDPLQIEFEISVVLLDDSGDRTDDLIAEAHALIEQVFAERWKPKGFHLGADGELHEGEVDDEPERIILSYDRPCTALARDPATLAELLAWAREQELDFVIGV
jgi:hypothetical protein